MRMDTPLVTFAIPAFSRPQLLAEALASIAAQTLAVDYNVVICDDGGLEATREVAARFSAAPCTYHRNEPPPGGVSNWNRCLRMARGRWVMVLHEDDAIFPWFLELTVPRLRDGLAAVCMRTVQGPAIPALARPAGGPRIVEYRPAYFLKSSMTPFPGVLIRRDLALQLGGFDERQGPLADYDFWYRLACAGPVEVVQSVGAFYRVAPGQWTERAWDRMLRLTHLLRLRVAREQLSRRRKLGRWMARFFTYRTARSYFRRFPERPASLERTLRFRRIPLSGLPSGWVWAALRAQSRPRLPPFELIPPQKENDGRFSIAGAVFGPFWLFFRSYVLRRGFLDGFPGFYIASAIAFNEFVRYSRLWESKHKKA
jgi:glycosyltransferase involved in cell wall biosynthesis